jgi:hypothetical protein
VNLHRFVIALLVLVLAGIAQADPRPFTFTYDTYPEGKGNVEFEQWATWEHRTAEDSKFNSYNFREEVEIGIADNFDLAFYVPNWHHEDSSAGSQTKFDSVGMEAIVYFSNPVTDFIGSGLYGEIDVGDESIEYEVKLLLQKDIGNWTLGYNLVIETEIENAFKGDEDSEVSGELANTFGAAYSLSKNFRAGGEFVVECAYDNWSSLQDTPCFLGPVFSYEAEKHWWVTVTSMFQLSSVDDEPDFQLRMIAGYTF